MRKPVSKISVWGSFDTGDLFFINLRFWEKRVIRVRIKTDIEKCVPNLLDEVEKDRNLL